MYEDRKEVFSGNLCASLLYSLLCQTFGEEQVGGHVTSRPSISAATAAFCSEGMKTDCVS